MIDDPLSIPMKTINYAKYDLPRLLNSLVEALHWDHSVFERVMAKAMAVPPRASSGRGGSRSSPPTTMCSTGPAWCVGRTRARSSSSGSRPTEAPAPSTSRSSV